MARAWMAHVLHQPLSEIDALELDELARLEEEAAQIVKAMGAQ